MEWFRRVQIGWLVGWLVGWEKLTNNSTMGWLVGFWLVGQIGLIMGWLVSWSLNVGRGYTDKYPLYILRCFLGVDY